ncbi:MAG: Tol-Pal system beta propeller repeat protein TolB [Desulfobacteraceae bacterium IS3]|nr:MAG: Tol-Pal system beta propeller repeat protein TolB [Desulfobacteraceae bacterium IS3]
MIGRIKFIFILTVLFLLMGPALSAASYDIINIDNPSLRKIPLAIPLFKILPDSITGAEISRKPADICSQNLEFTGYFTILRRDAFLEDPQNTDISGSNINFQNWTGIGAELLITGGISVKNNMVEMELRLFDTFKGQVLVGKRYKGWTEDQERIIRRFCSEVILYLTGSPGIFNSKIAFVSTGSGSKEIYVCDFDGGNPERVTSHKSISLFPAWSSDGKWIAYTSYAKGKPDIYVKSFRGGIGSVIANKGLNITPAWVPGKFMLAATLSFDGDQDIYLLTGKGEKVKRLTKDWGIDTSPTWSPDGSKMAFVSDRSRTPQIYILYADSGRVERLTFQGDYNTQPDWSPKGDKIAYSSRSGGGYNICTIGFDGRGPTVLGRGESPSWSPDGSMIVFSSGSSINVMTAYGTDQRRLLSMPGAQTNPKWSPDGME